MKINYGIEKPVLRCKFIEKGRVIVTPEQLFRKYIRLHNYTVLSLQSQSGMSGLNSY